jgi:hypothetical protein
MVVSDLHLSVLSLECTTTVSPFFGRRLSRHRNEVEVGEFSKTRTGKLFDARAGLWRVYILSEK